jgi:hypothetical protein
MRNHPSIVEASKKIFAEWEAMSPEEFKAMLDAHKKNRPPRCEPDTCGGACQGMGWCYTCEDFRGEAPDDHMEELMG